MLRGDLLRSVAVLYADETPARVAGELHYVHVACTGFLTAMHTGDRTKEAIDADGVLPGYAGTIVRDGYKGYEHITDALHAWFGAHGLRDLAGLHQFDSEGHVWARSMADPEGSLDSKHSPRARRVTCDGVSWRRARAGI